MTANSPSRPCFSCGYDTATIAEHTETCPECGQNLSPPYNKNIAAERARLRDANKKAITALGIWIVPIAILLWLLLRT